MDFRALKFEPVTFCHILSHFSLEKSSSYIYYIYILKKYKIERGGLFFVFLIVMKGMEAESNFLAEASSFWKSIIIYPEYGQISSGICMNTAKKLEKWPYSC